LADADARGTKCRANGRTPQADRLDHPRYHERVPVANLDAVRYGCRDIIVTIVTEPHAIVHAFSHAGESAGVRL
jgi:hypothetical protein